MVDIPCLGLGLGLGLSICEVSDTVLITSLLISQSLGQVGRITKVFPTGDVRVAVNSRMWTYNPRCLVHAPLEEVPEFEGA